MSVRGIGEGHRSSIGFRTGIVDAAGRATSTSRLRSPLSEPSCRRCSTRRCSAASSPAYAMRGEAADYVLDALGERFTRADLDERLDKLQTQPTHPGTCRARRSR